MRLRAIGLALALAVTAGPAAAAPARPSPSPTATPGRSARGTSPGVVLVFALLAAALLWQVRRGRRSAQEYAQIATSHFERTLESHESDAPGETGDAGGRDGPGV